MQDKSEVTEEAVKAAIQIASGVAQILLPYINDGPYVIDKFISFEETDHENPYDDPLVLKIEDTFGFMMAYRKPYSNSNRKSLKNYRNRLRKYCKTCYRLPKCFKKGDGCRVYYLKVAMTREITSPKREVISMLVRQLR